MSNNVLIKNKKGYKKTKLGWIPEDWEVKKLKSLVKINRNTLTENTKPEYQFYYLDISAVKQGKILIPHNTIIFSEAPCRARRIVKQNNILFSTVRPYLQSFAVMKNSKENFVASTGFAILSDFKNINNMYLYQSLYSNLLMNQYKKSLVGTNYPALNNTDMLNLKFICPNDIREQEKIAEILSAWDEGIDVIEKLIEQKIIHKNYLMQNFLVGKDRLKNCLTEISKKNSRNQIHNALSVTNSRGFINQDEQFERNVASKDLKTYKIVHKGEFAYNPSRINVGSIDLLTTFESGIVSPIYVVFKTDENKLLKEYFKHYFKTQNFFEQMKSYTQGGVRNNLNFKSLQMMKLNIPSLEQQRKISNILNSCDEEIYLLNSKLEKLKEQKKSLMQKLLTGQIRVNV